MNKIKMIAICGKAGSGKDTILNRICSLYPNFNKIVSCTTRPPREKEKYGVDYFYYTIEDFVKKISNQEMLEYTVFNGWYYGTDLNSLSKTKTNIGVFNPAGIYSLMANENIDLEILYVRASDKERLIRQLNREENPNVQEIIRRYYADEQDFQDFTNNCRVIDNDNIDLLTSKIFSYLHTLDIRFFLDKKD